VHDGDDSRVADAIADHYKPLGPNDTCPTAPESIVVALADKLDSLAAFFAIGEKPTGSRDPFALRRAAQGIIRLILENELRLSLRDVFEHALSPSWPGLARPSTASSEEKKAVDARIKSGHDGVVAEASDIRGNVRPAATIVSLLDFIADRLKVHLREQGVRHDLIAAVFALNEDDLVRLLARVGALQKFLNTQDGADLLIAYRRASNIVTIEERRDVRSYNEPVDPGLMRQPEEEAVYQRLSAMSTTLETFLRQEEFGRVMEHLATLRGPVDEFFDKVTVNVDDKQLRENRLRLLSRIRAVMNQVADFSQIEG
jgi:glycyl-tRNA synthetase beta chain